MSADDGVRCDRHVGEVFPPRCHECDRERLDRLEAETPTPQVLPWARATTEIIDEALVASGKSIDELAAEISVPRDVLLRQLGGDREFSIGELERTARALGGDLVAWVQAISERASSIAFLTGVRS